MKNKRLLFANELVDENVVNTEKDKQEKTADESEQVLSVQEQIDLLKNALENVLDRLDALENYEAEDEDEEQKNKELQEHIDAKAKDEDEDDEEEKRKEEEKKKEDAKRKAKDSFFKPRANLKAFNNVVKTEKVKDSFYNGQNDKINRLLNSLKARNEAK